MPQQMVWFFISIAFSFVAWGMVAARYIWPRLRLRPRTEALRISAEPQRLKIHAAATPAALGSNSSENKASIAAMMSP